MDFTIDNNNIEKSFDRIAKELLTRKILQVNDTIFQFTEIEFYYFHEQYHQDKYTHEHDRNAGEWRLHKSGIDITFQSTDVSDGGILIRGVKVNGKHINGSLKTLTAIIEAFGSVKQSATFRLKDAKVEVDNIVKTFRHFKSNKIVYEAFKHKPYRYLVELDNLDISKKIKNEILNNHSIL